ncbi:hypothetical protein E6C50_00405 [Flavobacterium supellecticarium]|uniref:Antitoxin component YwqK of the YwqJK toxin-antitoxin module n=1 Tax=Flavobacterium supellecticarium TaxID=2565924 RepID=A0A4S4A2S5_9FLAO|nr:hypothetical protein [Flavobacterium supellecticarium]THF52707.1 hypothetical protein E6C50_00405 [Flavobacterium supellecticarium]
MKTTFLTLCSLFSAVAFAQEINKTDDKGQRHGLWKGIYEDTKYPRYEGTFDHGKETGVFKYFDNTKAGPVIGTRDFSANDGSNYSIFFDQKGNKVSEGKIVNKEHEGEWKIYHKGGKPVMTLEYYKNGKLDGIRKTFYPNGAIAEEVTYVNGVKQGIYKKYSDKGVVIEETGYFNDQFDGPSIYRNAANEVTVRGQFKNGKKSGIWKFYEKNKLVKEVNAKKVNDMTFKMVTDSDGKKKPTELKSKTE